MLIFIKGSKYLEISNLVRFKPLNKALFNLQNVIFSRFFNSEFQTTPKKFSDMIQFRQHEAKCSVVIQVNSEKSKDNLYLYCSEFGKIKNMFHYSLNSSNLSHYIIVEFSSPKCVENLLSQSCHVSDNNSCLIPVFSQFLWFRALNSKSLPPVKDEVVLKQINGTNVISEKNLNSELKNCKTISDQISKIYNLTQLTETSIRLRFLVCHQIQQSLSGLFPFNSVLPFGSSVNSHGKNGCDLDMVVSFSEKLDKNLDSRLAFQSKISFKNERSQMQRHMECLADIIQLFIPGCVHVRRILQARVPIIKFYQDLASLECDISLLNLSGVYMSDLLYTFSCIDNRVQPLVCTVRKWAESICLTSPTPGKWITNFSLTLLVIYFLQQVNILPPINLLIKLADSSDKIITKEGVNCTFLHDLTKLPKQETKNLNSLEELLMEFFEFYATFDFGTNAISLNLGKTISKPENSPLYIVNPLEMHLNVSKNVSADELDRIRVEFQKAALKLDSVLETNTKDFVGLLTLFEPNNVTKHPFLMMAEKMKNSSQQKKAARLIDVEELFNETEDQSSNQKREINSKLRQRGFLRNKRSY